MKEMEVCSNDYKKAKTSKNSEKKDSDKNKSFFCGAFIGFQKSQKYHLSLSYLGMFKNKIRKKVFSLIEIQL